MNQTSHRPTPDEPVQLCIQESIAYITLKRPPLNIYDLSMRDGLLEALAAVSDIPDLKVMVLRSEGSNFCAGADLSEFGSAASILDGRRIRWDRDPWGLLLALGIPTVAALKGIAVGSGLEMALLCDFRVADRSAVLGLPETKLAMLPAAGGTQSLSALIGTSAAFPIVGVAETISPDSAWECGMLSVPPTDDLDSAVADLVDQLLQIEPSIMTASKRALAGARDLPLEQGLALEKRVARSVNDKPNEPAEPAD